MRHDNGNRRSCRFGSTGGRRTKRDNLVYLETDQFGRQLIQAIEFSLCPSNVNDNVFPLCVPKLAQLWRNASTRSWFGVAPKPR
jgi:hypothetical protein